MSGDALDRLRAALGATQQAGTAGFTHVHRHDYRLIAAQFERMQARTRAAREGSLGGDVRQVRGALWAEGLRHVGRAIVRDSPDGLDVTAEGVIDLAARRYVIDSGHLASLVDPAGVRDRSDAGDWEAPDPDRPYAHSSVLWLLDVLAGTTTATPQEAEEVRGVPCATLDVRCDLSIAARATPGRLPTPSVDDVDELLALPVRVWIGGGLVRRIVNGHALHTRTLELFDHGAPIDPSTWERPPARRVDRD